MKKLTAAVVLAFTFIILAEFVVTAGLSDTGIPYMKINCNPDGTSTANTIDVTSSNMENIKESCIIGTGTLSYDPDNKSLLMEYSISQPMTVRSAPGNPSVLLGSSTYQHGTSKNF